MGPRDPRAGKGLLTNRNGEARRGPHLRKDSHPPSVNRPNGPIRDYPQPPFPNVDQGNGAERGEERGIRGADERSLLRDQTVGGVCGGDGEEEYSRSWGFRLLRWVLRMGS
ncbi:hypothetical protein LINPERPRIM_LOCUS32421 [Linum perenne]